jgi:hypothetical protein
MAERVGASFGDWVINAYPGTLPRARQPRVRAGETKRNELALVSAELENLFRQGRSGRESRYPSPRVGNKTWYPPDLAIARPKRKTAGSLGYGAGYRKRHTVGRS